MCYRGDTDGGVEVIKAGAGQYFNTDPVTTRICHLEEKKNPVLTESTLSVTGETRSVDE